MKMSSFSALPVIFLLLCFHTAQPGPRKGAWRARRSSVWWGWGHAFSEKPVGHAGAGAQAPPTSPCGIFPQPSRNLDIAQNFFFPALSSFYLCAGAIEGARGPRSVVSTTVGVSVWIPGYRWSEVRSPTSAPPRPLHFAPGTFQKNQVSQREWRTVSALRFHGDKSF